MVTSTSKVEETLLSFAQAADPVCAIRRKRFLHVAQKVTPRCPQAKDKPMFVG